MNLLPLLKGYSITVNGMKSTSQYNDWTQVFFRMMSPDLADDLIVASVNVEQEIQFVQEHEQQHEMNLG